MMPYKYENLDQLRDVARLDPGVTDSLKKMTVKKIYDMFIRLDAETHRCINSGDDENAYIYLSRAFTVYEAMNKKLDQRFMTSQDGSDFKMRLAKLMNEFDHLCERLGRAYLNSSQKTHPKIEEVLEESCNRPILEDTYCDYKEVVRPQELIDVIEKKSRHILLLDYRTDKNEFIDYKRDRDYLVVVKLEPNHILPGCLLKTLIQSVERTDRPCLEMISSYELVVLLPDISEAEKPLSFLSRTSKTRLLYEALTTYNQYHPLKQKPLILEKGFRSWLMAYPCYVGRRNPLELYQDENVEFEKLLEIADKAFVLNIEYPDLSSSKPPITKEVFYDDLPKSGFYPLPLVSKTFSDKVKPREHIPSPADDPSIAASPSSLRKNLPSVDRSTKPYENTRVDKPDFKMPFIDRSVKPLIHEDTFDQTALPLKPCRNYEDALPQIGFEKKGREMAMRQTAVLAGARVAEIGSASTPSISNESRTPTQSQGSFPKDPQTHIQFDSLRLYNLVYEKALRYFMTNSKESSVIKKGFTGFINIGNTCFMNTTLQALFHTPNVIGLFRSKAIEEFINIENKFGTKGVISGCFSSLCNLYWSGKYSAIQPGYFLDIFAQCVNSSLADRKQHDAQEFLIYLLDSLHEDTNRITNKKPFEQNYTEANLVADAEQYMSHIQTFSSSPISDIFTLTTVSTLICESCKTTSVRFEGLNQLSVELPTGEFASIRTTLPECLDQFFGTTSLDALWDYDYLFRPQLQSKTKGFTYNSDLDVIHMNRACEKMTGNFVKNEIDIEFDVANFNMARHVHDKALKQNALYQLYAIINHSGTLNSGHYTSFVRHMSSRQEWLLFDDDKCIPIRPDSSLVTKNAFMLYYARSQ